MLKYMCSFVGVLLLVSCSTVGGGKWERNESVKTKSSLKKDKKECLDKIREARLAGFGTESSNGAFYLCMEQRGWVESSD